MSVRPLARVAAWLVIGAATAGCQHVMWYGRDAARTTPIALLSRCGEQFVVAGADEHRSFDAVAMETLAISGRGQIAYAALDDGAWTLVIDGHAVGPGFPRVASVAWSADQRTVIAVVGDERGDRVLVVRALGPYRWQWLEEPAFDAIASGSVLTSEAGALAYVAWRRGAAHVVVDREVGPGFEGIADLQLTPDGQPSYAARRDGRSWVVRNGQWSGPYEDVAGIVSDPAGSRIVALVRFDGAWHADDGRWTSPAYDRIGDLAVSARSGRVVFRGRRGERELVVIDDSETGPFAAVVPATLAIGGPQDEVVFAARDEHGEHVVVDGVAQEPWLTIEQVVIGGDGRVGFIATNKEGFVVVAGGEQLGAWSWAGDLRMSGEGREVFIAHDGGSDVVVEGTTRHRFDQVVQGTLRFASDGRTWGVAAVVDDQLVLGLASGAGPPVDMEELVGEVLRRRDPNAYQLVLDRWLEAELEKAASGR